MTTLREDIIRMAREAGLSHMPGWVESGWGYDNLERFAALVAAAERNKLAAWMIQFGFATGHGDTMEQLVDALGSEIVERIECEVEAERAACARVAEEVGNRDANTHAWDAAAAIRARSNA